MICAKESLLYRLLLVLLPHLVPSIELLWLFQVFPLTKGYGLDYQHSIEISLSGQPEWAQVLALWLFANSSVPSLISFFLT